MKNIIHKSSFKHVIVDNKVSTILKKNIKEFPIGKNFFYKVENSALISLHKEINKIFSEKIELNNASIAFRKKLSYLHLFEPHRKNYNFLRLDIRSFFHSIQIDDIEEVFKSYISNDEYIDEEKKQSLLDAFINIITYKIPEDSKNEKFKGKRVLPMGFITSPVISNIIFRQLDVLIQKLCLEREIIYTRYADDMLFSSSKNSDYVHSDDFIKEIRIIISKMKFKLNEHKTIRAKNTLSLNGYTIQYSNFKNKTLDEIFKPNSKIHEVRLSNKKTNIIKKMIHMIEREKKSPYIVLKKLFNYKLEWKFTPKSKEFLKYNHDQLINRLSGYRSYLLSIVQFNKIYHCTQENTIEKYLSLISDLDRIIERMRKV